MGWKVGCAGSAHFVDWWSLQCMFTAANQRLSTGGCRFANVDPIANLQCQV